MKGRGVDTSRNFVDVISEWSLMESDLYSFLARSSIASVSCAHPTIDRPFNSPVRPFGTPNKMHLYELLPPSQYSGCSVSKPGGVQVGNKRHLHDKNSAFLSKIFADRSQQLPCIFLVELIVLVFRNPWCYLCLSNNLDPSKVLSLIPRKG